ncbi:hypothetical protein N7507_009439 [Penicillium longicatenatum]|nr:hypothetical protein N7507_009439 [Penicillium longicatenatum]
MSNKQHAPPATKYALDGREVDLLHYIYARPDIKELNGNPQRVLCAIDEYHREFDILINVGAQKGQHIVNLISESKPSSMIELGVYIGYSAILFGDAIRSHGGKQYIGIEKNPEMGAIASQLVDLAGLRDTVQILVGSSDEVLQELVEEEELRHVEFIFLDHWKDLYLPDLWLLEEMDVLKTDVSVVIADNVIFPGAPEYRKWVEATTKQKREMVKGAGIGAVAPNPNLVYDTVLAEFETDFGLDAITITRVIGDESE